MVFRISSIPMYNILRSQGLSRFKLYSTGYSIDFIQNTIYNSNKNQTSLNSTSYNNTSYNNTYPPQLNCTYSNYIIGNCTRLQYELENGCNFHNYYIRNKCSIYEYHNYCNSINYNAGYCFYYDYKVYLSEYFYCYELEMKYGKCSYEHYKLLPSNDYFIYYYFRRTSNVIGYIIDYSNVKFFCDFKKLENNVFIFGVILMFIAFIFIITYLSIIKKKIKVENENGKYYYVILFFLFLFYIIFALISILFCYLLAYSSFLTDNRISVYYIVKIYGYIDYGDYDFTYYPINDKNEDYFPQKWWKIILSFNLNFIICILSLFFLIPIKKLILSHINLEDGNEENIKYKKTTLYIKEKKLDIEIKLVDDLVIKLDNEEKIYVFKEVKIPEIKKNNIYIYIDNFYIKEQLSSTNLYYYNMNIQIERLYELINLMIVIIVILIGLCNFFTRHKYFFEYYRDIDDLNRYSSSNYNDEDYYQSYNFYTYKPVYLYSALHKPSFKAYIDFEYYIEIIELLFSFIILFFYLFSFIKRLLNGGIKTKAGINKFKLIIKSTIVYNWIFISLSFVLFINAFVLSISGDYLSNFNSKKLIVHSSFNFIIMILYIPIIIKNNRIKKYINQVEKEMNSINNTLPINNTFNIDYIDLENKKHTLKPIIYNNYQVNLFYELEGENIVQDDEIENRKESEVEINNENLN